MKFFWEARKVIVLSVLIYIILKPVFFFGVVSQYIEQITLYTLIVILTSLGLNVIYGYTGQFSLGHAAFYGIGAYMSAYLTKVFGIENVFSFIPILFISGASAGLVGYLIGIPILKLRDDFLAIATLGLLMAFTYGCFLAGIGGALYAHLYTFLHPSNFDILKSIDFLIIVIVGGMGSITGTIYAGLIWVGFIEGLRIVLPAEIVDLRWVFIPLLLIALMMWRPYGIIAKK